MLNSLVSIEVPVTVSPDATRKAPAINVLPDPTETALPAAPQCPSVYVRWKGREYRIYKKQPHSSATWYYSWYEQNKRKMLNLKTCDRATAEATLKTYLDGQIKGRAEQMKAVIAGAGVQATSERLDVPLDRLLEIYRNTPTGANSPGTRNNNATRIENVLDLAKLPADAPLAKLLPALQTARTFLNAKLEKERSQNRQLSLKRTWNTNLRMVLSIFCDSALAAIEDKLTIQPADVLTLRTGGKKLFFPAVKKTVEQYRPPTPEILAATLEAWLKLDRNEFIAVGLALSFGLRRAEINQAHWEWIGSLDGYVFLDADADVKDKTGLLRTRALEPFYTIFINHCRDKGWHAKTGRCLEGSMNRRGSFDRNISDWLQALGWRTRLHLHALRAWAGSLVYTRYGVSAACAFCRHGDEGTTRKHYGWLRDQWAEAGKPVFIGEKLVEWGKA